MSSWWDRYLAPGDVRAARQRIAADEQQRLRNSQQTALSARRPHTRLDPSTRARRQNGLLFGGLAFTMLSLIVTRRSLMRKRQMTYPRQFTPSNTSDTPKVDGSLEAVEALGLASMNVFSFAMLTVGAAITYFDVADVQDLRTLMRQTVGEDIMAGESQADREIEGWVAEVLSRKDSEGKFLREGVAERLAEIEQSRKEKEKAANGKR